MNLFVIALLALAAFYFLMSDMLSFAVVCVAALVVVLYYYSSGDSRALQAQGGARGAARGSAQGEAPFVMKLGQKRKPHPELYRVRVYPTWENRSAWEETGRNIGFELSSLGGAVYRMFTGKHSEKGMDIQPEETFRGR
ncbi:MAG: hypothetical protein V1817_02775 [Candidatus Micrarchaeota archaeon]